MANNNKADPFRRVNVVKEPVLLLVEFCQVLGPKPIECLPKTTSFNLDQIAVWIMSAENDHGSKVTIFNQQMGIYAMIHYSTLLDITARAFQRPFAVAYISCEQISKEVSKKFDEHIDKVVNPLLNCNMTLFTHLSEQMVNLAAAIEEREFHQYYALAADEPTPEISKCVHELAMQIKRVGPRFKNAYSVLSYSNDHNCACGSSLDDFKIFFPLIGQASATDLMPLFSLCSCGKIGFDESFQAFYDDLSTKSSSSGAIIACNTPMINPVNAIDNFKYPVSHPKFRYDNTLIAFNKILMNILFCILIDEPVIVAAGKERESTMMDLLTKLSLLKPSKRKQQFKTLDNLEDYPKFQMSHQFFGISMSRTDSLNWMSEHPPYPCVQIDLNNQTVKCLQYTGTVLKPIHRLNFPSDPTLLSHIVYIMTNISRMAILANNSSFDQISKDFKLSEDDQDIVLNLLIELNVERHGYLLKPHQKHIRKSVLFNIS